jgi:large subunit ribosomal protein L25
MQHFVIKATLRSPATKGELNSQRLSGRIPAIVYGAGKVPRNISVDEKDFVKTLASVTESTILDLDVAGDIVQAFIKARQRDTLSHRIIHIDFLEVVKGKILHARVPLHLIGAAIGVKDGGVLENPAHDVEVECIPSDLPEKIEIDVAGLHVNHSIHVRDIPPMPGVKILTSPDLVIVLVKFAKAEKVEETAAVAVETPAAGAAAEAPASDTEKK